MYELMQVAEHSYYIESPAKIGVVRLNETDVVLIDSGSDKDAGKKALKVLNANGWKLKAIYNTHSHADHIGGNRYLQEQTGCAVYAPGLECDFTNHPILEPALLYGGFPPDALRHKFLMAQESKALPLTADVLPEGMTMLPLPGHSFDMVGFRTADNVVYLADCVSSRQTLEKYGLGYLWDVEASLATLEQVEKLEAARFMPSHAEATDDIAPLARFNREAILTACDRIAAFCAEPVTFDDLLSTVFDDYGMTMTVQQHALIGSTVKSYLTYLLRKDRVECLIEGNTMYWQEK